MDKEILTRFLSNKCSYVECEAIARQLERDEEALDQVEIFEDISEDSLIQLSEKEKAEMLKFILPPRKSRIVPLRFLVAASILLALVFSWLQFRQPDFAQRLGVTEWVYLENDLLESSDWHLLPDSSRIRLGPDARVKYSRDFATKREIVQMAGEITYYVQPKKESPFRVVNQGVETTALGTIFTVSEYDEHHLQIKLIEGRIEIKSTHGFTDQGVLLEEESTLVVNKDDFNHRLIHDEQPSYQEMWNREQHTVKQTFSVGSIAWSNRLVSFNGVSNADLFEIMERLFSVTIDVENPEITNGNFTGELYQKDHIEDLLQIFCEINGCTFTINNNIIKIM